MKEALSWLRNEKQNAEQQLLAANNKVAEANKVQTQCKEVSLCVRMEGGKDG